MTEIMTIDHQVPNKEIARRRTFAIVSHPDAGKTTLTEKFLLYGGAVQLAGSVTAGKRQRATVSDWMELEKQRGISISSTVLQFDYQGFRINLLDTPGHRDFSEDTYRVLTAVDAAVMVIDAGKGIEEQTRKLFEVCRKRGVPIFTFMNKMDRPSLEPLVLLDELASVLGIEAYPMNWPLGTGFDFKGVWDRNSRMTYLYERTVHGTYRAPVSTASLTDPVVRDTLDARTFETVCDEIELLDGAGVEFNADDILAGRTTPVYFGSALNNFGVDLLLDGFLKYSAAPLSRRTRKGLVEPTHKAFSGFVFKIQANMDPRHRDRIAFVRVVSGKFERNMSVTHMRTGEALRLGSASKVFGQTRETMDEAYPGDVVGIIGKSVFAIGDTLTEDTEIEYHEIPQFAPECFAYLGNPSPADYKRFHKGLSQLLQEGVVQHFELPDEVRKTVLLGAVGPLQFEVFQQRLRNEYGAESHIEAAPWTITRWIAPDADMSKASLPYRVRVALDSRGRRAILFPGDWHVHNFRENNPKVQLHDEPIADASVAGGGLESLCSQDT